MNFTVRKRMLWGIAGLLGAAPLAVGAAYQAVQTRRDDVRWPGLGERIDVDGRQVHVRRMGKENSAPTVVFESGLASPLELWGWVQPAVAEVAPTVTYDRADIGRSDAVPGPRTAERATADLRRLLAVLDITGPLVLVGHSYGGLLLRDFARRHPDRVAGVVLVDPTHPEQLERSTPQRNGVRIARAVITNSLISARFGWMRFRLASAPSQFLPLGEVERKTLLARMASTRNWRATADELDAWENHVVDEVWHATLPAEVPMFVLTAGETDKEDPIQTDLHRELTALSSASVHQLVPDASHLGLLCTPEHARVTTAAVLEVVDAVRTGRALKQIEIDTLDGGHDA